MAGGRGKNYCDRKDSALIGKYTDTTEHMHAHFPVPCECGGHEDVRYVQISDGQHQLKVTGGEDFHFSALPYSMEQYENASYEDELGESTATWLTIDACHTGLGGDTGWMRNIHPTVERCVIRRMTQHFSGGKEHMETKSNAWLVPAAGERPNRRVDVVLDTDTYNEIDDQYALAYLIASQDRLNLQGIYAAPFHNQKSDGPGYGMEKSYQEIMNILSLMGRDDLKSMVYKGLRPGSCRQRMCR